MSKNERFWTHWKVERPRDMYPQVKIWEPSNCRAKYVGRGSIIGAYCDIGQFVEIGFACLIQSSCKISNFTVIGDETFLGPDVNILNDKYMDGNIQPVRIGSRCRIGGGVIILPGVTIGDDVFVCAGVMITKDVPEGTRILPGNVKGGVVW